MRRNVLFAKTEKGASISGRIFTIVQTAKANSLVTDKYLEYVLENINKVPRILIKTIDSLIVNIPNN